MHVELRGVSKDFGKQQVLRDVNLEIEPAQIVALLGTNGAGKTTLLRLLGSILVPTSGEILFDGERLQRDRLDLRRRFHLLPDMPKLGSCTTLDYIAYVLRAYDVDRPKIEDEVAAMLNEFNLLTLCDSTQAVMSRGQSYKAALIGMIAVNPTLWMLDEPFASGMDPSGLAAFRRHARAATRDGGTVIYSTQILDVAENFADRLCILHEGRVAHYGTFDELKAGRGENKVLEQLFAEL